ncbi:MAG: M15 family metallopeptidase [Dysgonamonadaceae bacterium]
MKPSYYLHCLLVILFLILLSCTNQKSQTENVIEKRDTISLEEPVINDTIVDSDFTFDEAIANTKAPHQLIDQLVMIDVVYISTDGRPHKGQVVTNKKIAEDIVEMFSMMLRQNFVVEKAIPVVHYDWSDSLSMSDNNSYSFSYRNVSFSKHATGMAIDINPRFNPLRWKSGDRPNQPVGAVSDTLVNGTFHSNHPIVKEFKHRGFKWGHTFSKYYDDHHFERR